MIIEAAISVIDNHLELAIIITTASTVTGIEEIDNKTTDATTIAITTTTAGVAATITKYVPAQSMQHSCRNTIIANTKRKQTKIISVEVQNGEIKNSVNNICIASNDNRNFNKLCISPSSRSFHKNNIADSRSDYLPQAALTSATRIQTMRLLRANQDEPNSRYFEIRFEWICMQFR